MPAPYSYDLRSKAVAAVKRGEKKVEVSHFLKISRNTLYQFPKVLLQIEPLK
jgi:hypothetical protein